MRSSASDLFARGFSLLLIAAPAAVGQCLQWSPSFRSTQGLNGRVDAFVVYDDGTGPALCAGGHFSRAGGMEALGIAKWNGSTWLPLATYLDGDVAVLAVFDDGNGPALYAGGNFNVIDGIPAHGIAKWNGSQWSALGTGVVMQSGSVGVEALAVYDDGHAPKLYVGGYFSAAGSTPVASFAAWDGSNWSAVGGWTNWSYGLMVESLAVFDDGLGPALYVGGAFTSAGGIPAQNIAKWDGSIWSPLGSGTGGNYPTVDALAVFDDGSGPALCAAGGFTSAGGITATKVAKWDGSSWSALGTGLGQPFLDQEWVRALTVFDFGTGPRLCAGGDAPGYCCGFAAILDSWDGTSWSPIGGEVGGASIYDSVRSLAVFDDGTGAGLFAGGQFTNAGDRATQFIARWNGANWDSLGEGYLAQGISGAVYGSPTVNSFQTWSVGGAPVLLAGGDFLAAGDAVANGIAAWNGSAWTRFDQALNPSTVNVLGAFALPSGTRLLAGGFIQMMSGPIEVLVEWTGSGWVGHSGNLDGGVQSMAAYAGSIYIGGLFGYYNHIVRDTPSGFVPLGNGIYGDVLALAPYDDGSGPALFAAGTFGNASGVPGTTNIARWDGTSWSSVGGGVNGAVECLMVFDDGSGPALYAGGNLTLAGSTNVNHIAKWNGNAWSPVGLGLNGLVRTLGIFDDGSGPALYAGGDITSSGSTPIHGVAKWTGTTWIEVSHGVRGSVRTLWVHDDSGGDGPALFVGGDFREAGGVPSSGIAEGHGCDGFVTSLCFGDGTDTACPCGNSGSRRHGCENSASSGGALIYATGTVAPDTMVLHASGETPNATTIFLQGSQFMSPAATYGDGLRCAAGTLKRLYIKVAAEGTARAPEPSDPSITQRSAALGDPILPGTRRYYQTYYRDPLASFCPPPQGSTFNTSNVLKISW